MYRWMMDISPLFDIICILIAFVLNLSHNVYMNSRHILELQCLVSTPYNPNCVRFIHQEMPLIVANLLQVTSLLMIMLCALIRILQLICYLLWLSESKSASLPV